MKWTWNEQCNSEGKITADFGYFFEGGRESLNTHWELEKTDEDEDYYYVHAVCTESDYPMVNVGYELDYEMPKDISLFDIDSYLQNEYEQNL